MVDRLAAGLLRRHVLDRPDEGAGARRAARDRRPVREVVERTGHELGQAEVQDLDQAVFRDHQVLGLEIPVNDPRVMRLGQALGR